MLLKPKFRLQYISDIHLEQRVKLPSINPRAKYLALLGDIGNPHEKLYSAFIKECSHKWDKVLLISGNHEYNNGKYSVIETNNLIKSICNKHNNVYYLDNTSTMLEDYVILGTPLWSANLNIPFYRHINYLHINSVEFLNANINASLYENDPIIILSHYLPTYNLLADKYKNQTVLFNYASNLDHLIKPPVKAWLCGHSHSQVVKYINGVYCGINTLGYPYENHNINDAVLELYKDIKIKR